MKIFTTRIIGVIMLLTLFTSLNAQYTETMDSDGLTKNMKTDYGLVNDNAETNQSTKLQQAIDDVTTAGGGNIVIPKGTYRFSNIIMKSNVHILVDAGTVMKPTLETSPVFLFSTEKNDNKIGKFIENVSLRGVGGSFIIDYHFKTSEVKQRAINVKMVKNFLISDLDVKDNYTAHCGISFSPTSNAEDVSDWGWEVTRPTNGTVKNIRHFRGHPGYGQLQVHGAQSCHFENMYSEGGYSLRLESGADNINVGLFDITGKNITCKNGKGAMIMGPHSAKNGKVTVDGLTAISCSVALTFGDGHVKPDAPDQTPGYYSSESSVKNIHAIFGTEAQFKGQALMRIPNTDYYDDMKLWSNDKDFSGPSITAVTNNAHTYTVTLENITMEGFPYNNDKPILLSDEGFREGAWGTEKTNWKNARKGDDGNVKSEWLSDKGVTNDDYSIPGQDTGVEWVKDPVDFSTYPNPVKNKLFVSGAELEKYAVDIRLLDMMGKTVLLKEYANANSNEIELNIDSLAAGYYLLTLTDARSNLTLGSSKVLVAQ